MHPPSHRRANTPSFKLARSARHLADPRGPGVPHLLSLAPSTSPALRAVKGSCLEAAIHAASRRLDRSWTGRLTGKKPPSRLAHVCWRAQTLTITRAATGISPRHPPTSESRSRPSLRPGREENCARRAACLRRTRRTLRSFCSTLASAFSSAPVLNSYLRAAEVVWA
jgi:hypothetical protein